MSKKVNSLDELVNYLKCENVDVKSARELCDKCHIDKPLNQFKFVEGYVSVYSDGSWRFIGRCICKKCF